MLTFKRLHSFSFTLFTVKITQMINAIKIAWKRNYFPVASPLVYLTYKKKPNDKINLFFFWFVFFLNSFQTSESDSEPIVSNARVTLNWYGQGPGGCSGCLSEFLWTHFSRQLFEEFVFCSEMSSSSSHFTQCHVSAEEKRLMCNKPKQVLLSWTSLIAD